jgi:uncharacterized protein YjbI with pentapeptide repeats
MTQSVASPTIIKLYSNLSMCMSRYWATLLYATLRYSTLLYATLRYATLLYATLRYSTLLYATLRYSTLLYVLKNQALTLMPRH